MVVSGAAPRGPRNSQIFPRAFPCMDVLPDITLFHRRLDELAAQMSAPSFYANPRHAAEVTREHQKLTQLVADHQLHG